MKVKIIATGKMKSKPLLCMMQMYMKRMKWAVDLREYDEITPKILTQLKQDTFLVVLDERGVSYDSHGFSKKIESIQMQGKTLVFLIGGAQGFDSTVREQAHLLVSFGKSTWPHMMVRVMLMEQIYRAQQILAGHPYHKD